MHLGSQRGFTVVETLVGVVILSVLFYVVADMVHVSGRQTNQVQRHSAAMQNAYILMETLQHDLKQLAILPGRGFPLFHYSLVLSTHGKSLRMRRSSEASNLGSTFTIVTYQLTERVGEPGFYSFVRSEKTPEGVRLPNEKDEPDRELALASLVLKSLRTEFVTRIEKDGRMRHYLELTLVAVESGCSGGRSPVVYPISNLFQIPSPERPEDFAREAYLEPPRNITARLDQILVVRGPGNEDPLEPPSDLDGETGGKSLADAGDYDANVVSANPFTSGVASVPAVRRSWVATILLDLVSTVGPAFRGRMVGEVTQQQGPGSGSGDSESFVIHVGSTGSTTVAQQVDQILARMAARGTETLVRFLRMFHQNPSENELSGLI